MCQYKFPINMTLALTRRIGTFGVRLISKSTIQIKAQTHFSYTCLSSSHSHGRYMFFLRHVFSGMRRLSTAILILTTSREDEWMVRTQNIGLCIPEAVCSLSSPSETRWSRKTWRWFVVTCNSVEPGLLPNLENRLIIMKEFLITNSEVLPYEM